MVSQNKAMLHEIAPGIWANILSISGPDGGGPNAGFILAKNTTIIVDSLITLRAAREMLAVQASDWAFLDATGQAGDYPFRRSVDHASAAYEAIHSAGGEEPDPTLRSLAPDLEMASLTTP